MLLSFSPAQGRGAPLAQTPLIVIVGGHDAPRHLARLEQAFPHHRIQHCATRTADASSAAFEGALRTPGLALVVMVTGLSRTDHSRAVHRICRTLGVPVVHMRRIPHPNALRARLDGLRLAHKRSRTAREAGR